jgi:hypothetical protein
VQLGAVGVVLVCEVVARVGPDLAVRILDLTAKIKAEKIIESI